MPPDEREDLADWARRFTAKRAVNQNEEDAIIQPLLFEINLIFADKIKEFVRACLYNAPPQFWDMPAGWTKYHAPDERKAKGAVLHVRRSVRTYQLLSEAQNRSLIEMDYGIAALLLHDVLKGGADPHEKGAYNHNYVVETDEWMRQLRTIQRAIDTENSGFSSSASLDDDDFEVIARFMRIHLGRHSPVPELQPITTREWDVHLSDYLASGIHWVLDGDEEVASRWKLPPKKK